MFTDPFGLCKRPGGKGVGACVVLGSATPSLESRYNAEKGKYTLLELPGRVAARPMPEVELIDMRQEILRAEHLVYPM